MTIKRGERTHTSDGSVGEARGEADIYELERTDRHTGRDLVFDTPSMLQALVTRAIP